MPDYRSAADQRAHEQQQQQLAQLAQLFGQKMHGDQEMAGIEAHGQQAKELAVQKDVLGQKGQERNLGNLKQLMGDKDLPEGVGYSLGENGNVSATRGFDPNAAARHNSAQASNQAKALAQQGKALVPYEDALESNRRFQESLDLGSSVGDKNAAIMAARLGEGAKARIQQAIIQGFMKQGKSIEGASQEAENFFNGTSQSTLPNSVRNDMRALGHMHYQGAKRDFEQAQNQLMQQAPIIAPDLQANGQLTNFTNSWGARGKDSISNLEKRYQANQQQGGVDVNQRVQQAQAPSQGGLKGFFSKVWNGTERPQAVNGPSFNAAAQPQGQMPATGQAGALNPPSSAGPQAPVKQMRQKSTGKIFNVMPDGSMQEAQ